MNNHSEFDYELIYGARRLFITRHINAEIMLEIRDLSVRKRSSRWISRTGNADISAYERGRSYARWLRSGMFSSQEELARKLKNSASSVSRLLKVAGLPTRGGERRRCHGHPRELGCSLADAVGEPDRRRRIIARARALASSNRLPPEEVYRGAAQGRGTGPQVPGAS